MGRELERSFQMKIKFEIPTGTEIKWGVFQVLLTFPTEGQAETFVKMLAAMDAVTEPTDFTIYPKKGLVQ